MIARWWVTNAEGETVQAGELEYSSEATLALGIYEYAPDQWGNRPQLKQGWSLHSLVEREADADLVAAAEIEAEIEESIERDRRLAERPHESRYDGD